MAKKQEAQQREYAPDEVNEHGEYIRIGGSPVPGIILRQVLRGHTATINRIAWSPDGQYLASPSYDKTIRIWDVEQNKSISIIEGSRAVFSSVQWSPDGRLISSGSSNNEGIWIWDTRTKKLKKKLESDKQNTPSDRWFYDPVWSHDGKNFMSFSNETALYFWEVIHEEWLLTDKRKVDDYINALVFSPDGQRIAYNIGSNIY